MSFLKNRRKISNYIVGSRAQLRFFIPFAFLLALSLITNILMFWHVSMMREQAIQIYGTQNPEFSASAALIEDHALMLGSIGIVLTGLVSLGFWIIYSHRIFGPAYAIRVQIGRLCDNDFEQVIQLRKYDELKDLARDANRLTSVLKGKASEGGFSILEVLIALGIASIGMLAVISMMTMSLRQQGQTSLTFQAANFRTSLVSALNNQNGWMNTYKNVANNQASGSLLDCLANSVPCTTSEPTDLAGGGVPIQNLLINKIFDASNKLVYDASQPNLGVSGQGVPCANFVDPLAGPGNDSCPLRFEALWSAECKCTNLGCAPVVAGDTCLNPQIQFQINVKYNPSTTSARLSFNPTNYGTPPFLQGQSPGGTCWVLSGTNLYETCATNVGIGTTTPSNLFSVTGSTNASQVMISSTGGSGYITANTGSDGLVVSAGTKFDGTNWIATQTSANAQTIYNGGISWYGDTGLTIGSTFTPTPRLVLTSAGNVGIGTTSPAGKLDVLATGTDWTTIRSTLDNAWVGPLGVLAPNLTAGHIAGITIGISSTQYNAGMIGFDFVAPNSLQNSIRLRTLYSSGAGLAVDGNGNVGIGTTSPISVLEAAGNKNGGFVTVTSTNNTSAPQSGAQFTVSSGIANNYAILAVVTSNPTTPNPYAVLSTGDGSSAGLNFVGGVNTPVPFIWTQGGPGPTSFERMRIAPTGNVGIGITNPSYTLHVVGTAGLSTGTAWTNASDIRLKDLHGDYEYGLDEVTKLHTVRFTYKKDNPLGLPSDHPMTGFIAQEVQKIIPDAVHENKNGYLELNVDPIHWAVVNAVKELKALIDDIYNRLAGHDQAIADLALAKDRDIASVKADAATKDKEIQELKQENAAMKAYLCGKDPSAAICQ